LIVVLLSKWKPARLIYFTGPNETTSTCQSLECFSALWSVTSIVVIHLSRVILCLISGRIGSHSVYLFLHASTAYQFILRGLTWIVSELRSARSNCLDISPRWLGPYLLIITSFPGDLMTRVQKEIYIKKCSMSFTRLDFF
jgi:hypothetical protein